jgi:hypothetical protein
MRKRLDIAGLGAARVVNPKMVMDTGVTQIGATTITTTSNTKNSSIIPHQLTISAKKKLKSGAKEIKMAEDVVNNVSPYDSENEFLVLLDEIDKQNNYPHLEKQNLSSHTETQNNSFYSNNSY